MSTPKDPLKQSTGQIGACMSDLVANVHALVTEGETGKLLQRRLREIMASTNAIMRHSEMIAQRREPMEAPYVPPKLPCCGGPRSPEGYYVHAETCDRVPGRHTGEL
jgi:hypothetical protein